jgi:hypothetical protein
MNLRPIELNDAQFITSVMEDGETRRLSRGKEMLKPTLQMSSDNIRSCGRMVDY